jgi:uncharacterized protein YyaL (SSP411 family)
MTERAAFTNRLAHESSPYLRQHMHNPVDWCPWGPEALARARELDRPIFLSIGYAACHWCHVMEHESFENEEIARLLNESFVSIKVDREERPDLDQIYMAAVQALTGQGGWPMSVFLTPDLRPFTGGTYFPPDDRYGRPGFARVLRTVAEWWRTRRGDIDRAAADLTQALQGLGQLPEAEGELGPELLSRAVSQLNRAFDPRHGGFGSAPKFPHPMDLRMLLRAHLREGDEASLRMVRITLDQMGMGGIYDHLGGGFARYSTDARWLVPHFEKMLYDNALLVPAYLEAFQVTREPFYREVAEETLGWVLREMTSPEGPFFSTLDADSEGVEGKYYVWTAAEIDAVLGDDAPLFRDVYGITAEGNWEHGNNILHRTQTFAELARRHNVDEADLRRRLGAARKKLFEVRNQRVRPGLDDKMLTSWNGLMIGALAFASAVLDRLDLAAAAAKAADFILQRMRKPDGRLLHTWRQGSEPKLDAYLEDYAYLMDGLISLYEATFEPRWIEAACDLAGIVIDQFWDDAEGGFFNTGRNHEQLIARAKDQHDNATPSSNAMAVLSLLRLAKLTERSEYRDRAKKTLQQFAGLLANHPTAVAQMFIALDFWLGPVDEVAIVGSLAAEDTRRVLRAAWSRFWPRRVLAVKSPLTESPELEQLVPLLAYKTFEGEVTTYVCRDFSCRMPLIGADATVAAWAGTPE